MGNTSCDDSPNSIFCFTESKGKFNISDFLDNINERFLSDLCAEKSKDYSLKLNHKGQDIFISILNRPLDYGFNSMRINDTKETVCVFYMFNYYNSEQLEKSIISFINEIILKDKLDYIQGREGYFDVKYSKHFLISAYEEYQVIEGDKYQYLHFPDMATREVVTLFNESMNRLVSKLNNLKNIEVKQAIQSDESEAFYLVILYKSNKQLKLSIRNHPINTKCQMCCYYNKYNDFLELEDRIVNVFRNFNWNNYRFSTDSYLEILPEDLIKKPIGFDLGEYTLEQMEFMNKNRIAKKMAKLKEQGFIPTLSNLDFLRH